MTGRLAFGVSLVVAAAVVVGMMAAPAGGGEAAPSAAGAVTIQNFAFHPAGITVSVGEAVTWTNKDAVSHTATADDGAFDTGLLGEGESGTVTMSTAGTIPYFCAVHPEMRGTVVVQAGVTTTPSQLPSTGDAPSSGLPLGLLAGLGAVLLGAGWVLLVRSRGIR